MQRQTESKLRELVRRHLRQTVGRGPKTNKEGERFFGLHTPKSARDLKKKDPSSRVRAGDPVIISDADAAAMETSLVDKATKSIDDLTAAVATMASEELARFLSTDAVSKVLAKEPDVAKKAKPKKPKPGDAPPAQPPAPPAGEGTGSPS